MKTLTGLTLIASCGFSGPGCAIAQDLAMPAIPITVDVTVRDPDGRPVENVTVNLSLPRYRLGDKNQKVSALTDTHGGVRLTGIAQQDYIVGAGKQGFYYTVGPHRVINDEKGFQRFATGVQKVELELRPKKNPIFGIRIGVDRRPLPVTEGPMGFDLEVGDWVAPFGKGKTSDFIFTLEGRFTSIRDYEQRFTLRFSRPLDGIMSFRHPKQLGSALKWPYEAPLTGYDSSHAWVLKWDPKQGGRGETVDHSGETNYIFRVRSEVDENGNLIRAMYGVVSGDFIPVAGNNEIGRSLSFIYALNPDWTRNLEFDPEKTVSSPR